VLGDLGIKKELFIQILCNFIKETFLEINQIIKSCFSSIAMFVKTSETPFYAKKTMILCV
jgi:hypothetical protein